MTDVWNTIENMRKLGASIHAFFQVLEDKLQNEESLNGVAQSGWGSKTIGHGWCYNTEFRPYLIKNTNPVAGPSGPLGCLTVRVELWREVEDCSLAWHLAKEPLIYIGFAPDVEDYWRTEMALDYRGFPSRMPDGSEVSPPTQTSPCLWSWCDDPEKNSWDKRTWYFVIRLFDIDSRQTVEREIISPVRSLLVEGKNPGIAFDGKKAIRMGGEQI